MHRFVFTALLLCAPLFAQFDTATVLGTIKDPSGNVIPSSKVVLANLADGTLQTAGTDSQGNYQFLKVRIGDYSLKAEAEGFKAATAERFTVTVNAHQRVDLTLPVGSVTESVTVSGAAAVLETDSSDRGQVIATRQILDLPLNGRSYADLTLLAPGVRKSVLEDGSITSRDASYNVNGQRSAFNNFVLDGVDNNAYGTSNQGFSNQVVQINPDAVAEYRVATDNYSAEYGRASGAVINATIRSGTNSFHGSAWEFLRNTQLNAVGFFQPLGGVKPVYQQNQFGASLGGRIIKDKLFFFVDYEGLRRVQRALTFATIPTAAYKAGNFGTAVKNPYTGQIYADGVVPASAVSPFARAVLNALPDPNVAGLSNNYSSLPRASITDDKGDWKIDYIPNQKLNSFVRYSQREANLYVPGNIPGVAGGNNNGTVHEFQQQIAAGSTYSINPTTLIEARLGISWFDGGKIPIGVGQPSLLAANGIGGLPTDPAVVSSLNSQGVTGYSQFGRQSSNPQFQNPFVVNPKVNFSKYLGRHTLKAGYEYQNITTTIDDFNPVYGQDTYNGLFSNPGVTSPTTAQRLAYGLTDFLFGARDTYSLNNFVIIDLKQQMHFGYLQDDFKVSHKLTLNMGIRYEFATPQYVADNRLANFDPATNSLIQAKNGSLYDRALVNPRKHDWAPRFGFAWRAIDKTVVRGGYGISWVHFNRLGGENLLAYNGPNIVNATFSQSPSNLPLCTSSSDVNGTCFRPTQLGYPANFAVPANFNPLNAQARYIPKDNPDGYVQSWHLNIQREITPSLVVDAAYVGSHSVHLMVLGDWNQAVPNQVGQNLSLQARRPIGNFNAIEVAEGIGFANYHSFQLKVEKRYSNGLYILNSFTWSKAIDNASGHLETANGDNSRVNLADLRDEKGLSGYDQPFNNTTAIVWDLPVGRGRQYMSNANRVLDGVLGGWQFSVINTAVSGLPVNLSYNPSSAFQVSGLPTYRPNIIGNPLTPGGGPLNYLNPATVLLPTDVSHPFGNAGRNIVRGPGLLQPDLAMHKQFRLWSEASKLEFRMEAFNAINRTNLGAPDGNRSNATFGTITSLAGPARQLQFGLKLYY
jgi:hypothetical protein